VTVWPTCVPKRRSPVRLAASRGGKRCRLTRVSTSTGASRAASCFGRSRETAACSVPTPTRSARRARSPREPSATWGGSNARAASRPPLYQANATLRGSRPIFSEDGVRSIALGSTLAEELWQHRRRSRFQGDDERVFCSPPGGPYRREAFRFALQAALTAAGIDDYVRPFHDLRHTAITNDAAAGSSAIAVMANAGHANMATTKRYLHLAGVVFRDEADALERRLLGTSDVAGETG
jgi:integrase-like protein